MVMGVILESDMLEASCTALLVFWLLFVYFVQDFDYWQQRGVPYKPAAFPFGSLPKLVFGTINQASAFHQVYQQFKHERFFGIISVCKPTIFIKDPELIKEVMSKKFNHFTDRHIVEMSSKEYLNHNLVTLKGDEWKEMRLKLTPAYTACKMKMMFFLVRECSKNLRRAINEKVDISDVIDVRNIVSRFTIDTIGSCAFGLEVKTLLDEQSQFYKIAHSLLKYDFILLFKVYLISVFPIIRKLYLFNLIKPTCTEYFTNLIRQTVAYREKNRIHRFDFLDLLIRIRQNESILDEEEMDITNSSKCDYHPRDHNNEGMMIEQIAAETYVFFGAGFETSSSVVTFCLYELACVKRVQELLFEEIEDVISRCDGELSFQALQEMTYLDQVVKETMRLYPSLPYITRCCTKEFKIPKSNVTIEKGIPVIIPIYSLQHDSKYFPDPETFNPDRFNPENYNEKEFQYVYMPFGEGPRMCIGLRFGLMMVKAAIVTLLQDYSFSLAPDTDIPLQLDSRSPILQPAKPLHLVFTRRTHEPTC